MRQIVLIAHNIRSAHNVGSLLRTADGFGISHVYLTGYTPYPQTKNDERLPHLAAKISRQIDKTALGAAESIEWSASSSLEAVIKKLKEDGYTIAALEQSQAAVAISNYSPPTKIALIVGSEVDGLDRTLLGMCDIVLEIPMFGQKESFNVAVAAAIALYQLRLYE